MVKQISLYNKTAFTCQLFVNGAAATTSKNKTQHNCKIDSVPCLVQIKIWPWKIKPHIRLDGHLVNYGLAGIKPWDHELEFELHEDHGQRYFNNIIEAKKQYLSRTGQNIPDNMESYVGVNNAYPEIIEQIKDIIKK